MSCYSMTPFSIIKFSPRYIKITIKRQCLKIDTILFLIHILAYQHTYFGIKKMSNLHTYFLKATFKDFSNIICNIKYADYSV